MRLEAANRPASGFTLIELVITVAILGVLAMLAVPMLQATAQRQKEIELRSALREIRSAIDAYHQAVVDKKIQVAQDSSGYPPDLETLVKGIADSKSPDDKQIYFLRRLPRDPFFANPDTPAAETWGLRSYASSPDDPQPGDDVFDVYSLSSKKGLNGVPYREW